MGLSTQRRREDRVRRPDAWISGGGRPPNAGLFVEVLAACLCVLVNSEFPCCSEGTGEYILARGGQANVRVSHFSPAARNGQENLGRLLHERGLLLQGEHQISVALRLGGERSEFPASYTKRGQSCVGVFFHSLQTQCNLAKICCGHLGLLCIESIARSLGRRCDSIGRCRIRNIASSSVTAVKTKCSSRSCIGG